MRPSLARPIHPRVALIAILPCLMLCIRREPYHQVCDLLCSTRLRFPSLQLVDEFVVVIVGTNPKPDNEIGRWRTTCS